jgi:hypothetical protein
MMVRKCPIAAMMKISFGDMEFPLESDRYAAFLYPDRVLDLEIRDPMGSIFQTIFLLRQQ